MTAHSDSAALRARAEQICAAADTAGVGLAAIAWLTRHAKDVPAIMAAYQAVVSAPIGAKWEAFKALGDIVVPILRDYPGFPSEAGGDGDPVIGPLSVSDCHDQLTAIGDGKILEYILALVSNPAFLQLVQLLISLVAGQ